jgi:hypothetical protein
MSLRTSDRVRGSAALPAADASIDALASDARERIGVEWLRRAEVELTAAALSAQIARGLLLDGAIPEVLEMAAVAVADEVRHASLCQAVAERYLGRTVAPPRARPVEEPTFGDASPELNRLLGLVLHSCISETMATVCLNEGMLRCVSPTVRAATQQLLEDDLRHARLGWAHLGSPHVGSEAKWHVGRALPTLLRLGAESWMREPRPPAGDAAHGVLGADGFRALTATALTDVVLPGFDHVGVDTRDARAFWAEHELVRHLRA